LIFPLQGVRNVCEWDLKKQVYLAGFGLVLIKIYPVIQCLIFTTDLKMYVITTQKICITITPNHIIFKMFYPQIFPSGLEQDTSPDYFSVYPFYYWLMVMGEIRG